VLAYLRWQRKLGAHGHPMDEATSPLADPANPDAKWRYYADPLPIVDYAQKAKLDAEDAWRDGLQDGESMNGLIFTVERIPVDRSGLL